MIEYKDYLQLVLQLKLSKSTINDAKIERVPLSKINLL